MQFILVYTPTHSNRINYIFDFILREFLGLTVEVTTDFNLFMVADMPKINYSYAVHSESLQLSPDHFLTQSNYAPVEYSTLNPVGKCFYWLSRYEEHKTLLIDQHKRFLGFSTMDYSKPHVDQICIDIQQQLLEKFPTLVFKERNFHQINTHDVDYAWKYLNRSAKISLGSLAKKILRGQLKTATQQIKVLSKQEADPYDTYTYLEQLAKKHKTPTIFFWLLADYAPFDKNHSWENIPQRDLINEISQWATIGIHPSYQSNYKTELLDIEVKRLSEIRNEVTFHSRQHFIKLSLPTTYQRLIKVGIKADYSMGFANRTGFRAGTSTPFLWFDLTTNEVTSLKIYPFVAMDVTLKNYLNLSPHEAIAHLSDLKNKIKAVQGTFITLFHQSNLSDEWIEWRTVYESLFDDKKD